MDDLEKFINKQTALQETSELEKLALLYRDDIDRTNKTIATAISSSELFRLSYASQLTSMPLAPYDQYKAMYLDPQEPVLTIEQLPPPKYVALSQIRPMLSAAGLSCTQNFLTNLPHITAGNLEAGATLFTKLSCGQFVTDKEKMKEHFVFIELIKNMTQDDIQKRPLSTALKLINEFIRVYK